MSQGLPLIQWEFQKYPGGTAADTRLCPARGVALLPSGPGSVERRET
jgi:hypothetical protein